MYVTVRPPHAIPGVADVEILVNTPGIREIRIVPLPLTGGGAQFAPVADVAAQSREDPRLFTGHLWMMTAGAWQIRVAADGEGGRGTLSVPVPTLPQATLKMSPPLGALLFVLMLLLAAGFVAIVSALAREAALDPGAPAHREARRRGRIAGAVAFGLVVVVAVSGNWWWSAEASNYARYVYKPLAASASVADGRLRLKLQDPGWIPLRRLDDLIADHGHLMHLFVVSGALDRFWHLHPEQVAPGTFERRLPDLPAGQYELFADVVHVSGLSETAVATFQSPATEGGPLEGDDSVWNAGAEVGTIEAILPDGARMVWVRDSGPPAVRRLTLFTFRIERPSGEPTDDLELYMGMPGHAVFVRKDRRVFAHVHPSGSVPMAALQLGHRALGDSADQAVAHAAHGSRLPSTVTFPFGFPEAGDYRIFVQVKRQGRVDTAAFDVRVG